MERWQFIRAFKPEAVTLVRDRGVSAAQASRDLDVHANVLLKGVRISVSRARVGLPALDDWNSSSRP